MLDGAREQVRIDGFDWQTGFGRSYIDFGKHYLMLATAMDVDRETVFLVVLKATCTEIAKQNPASIAANAATEVAARRSDYDAIAGYLLPF